MIGQLCIHKVEKECSSCALEGLREGAAGSPESHAVVRDGYLKQAILSRVKNSMGSGDIHIETGG